MSKLDMNLFAFVAWLGRNQHVHSEDGLTVNDGYEWYNYMWNMWLKNSDIGRKISNGEITMIGGDNNPDTNTNTTGNILDNMWGGDTTSTTEKISHTWGSYRLHVNGTKEDADRIKAEKQIWDKTVNDGEQAPYKVTTRVSKPNEKDDGTLAVIEITIDIKQR
jgi:hypothetical protein